jgi:adenine nucleotide transporter 17
MSAATATSYPISPITHAISGCVASALSLLLLYPLEHARIELQAEAAHLSPLSTSCVQTTNGDLVVTDDNQHAVYRIQHSSHHNRLQRPPKHNTTLRQCLLQLLKRNQLYRGVTPNVITLAASQFIFFYVHALIKFVLPKQTVLASCVAGLCNVLMTNPLWVANLRITTGQSSRSTNLWKELLVIQKTNGSAALWQGTWTSILLVSNPVLQFFVYERFKTVILSSSYKHQGALVAGQQDNKRTLAPLEAFGAGAVAKGIATIATYPLQVIQAVLRMQNDDNHDVDNAQSTTNFNSTWNCLVSLYQRDGWRSLFAGMKAKLLQTVLTAAFTFLTYEQILRAVHRTHVKLMVSQGRVG